MNDNKILVIFNDTITDNAILNISEVHNGLVHDFSNQEEFKQARKVTTEMNKLLKSVDEVGILAAKQVTELRNDLKERIETAYSGTVAPYKIEKQKRDDEALRIKEELNRKLESQKNILNMMKGASARAMHLPIDDVEVILNDIMNVDLSEFDGEMAQEAQAAKDISLAQLTDAMKYATEKETLRKEREVQDAKLMDKDDEIAKLKAMLEAQKPEPKLDEKPDYDYTELRLHFLRCLIDAGVDNWDDGYDYAVEAFLQSFPGADVPSIQNKYL